MSAPVPFPNCWWVTDSLLAGPAFFTGDLTTDVRSLAKLEAAGISTIVSLASYADYYPDETEADIFAWAVVPRFIWFGFDIPIGTAPDKDTMLVILQWIDGGLLKDKKVYLHSGDGCGRAASVVGCWLARHGIAVGTAALDHMAEQRVEAGLSELCAQSAPQIEAVTHWRMGR